MTFSDRARHDSKIDQLYGDEPSLVRDYVLMRVDHPAYRSPTWGEDERGVKIIGFVQHAAHTDFFAFHSGDDAEVPACVPIGETLCDYMEDRATVVGYIDRLLPGEVEAAFLAMVKNFNHRRNV